MTYRKFAHRAAAAACCTALMTLAQACGAGFANNTAIETQALSPHIQGGTTSSTEPSQPTSTPDVTPTPSVTSEPTPTTTQPPTKAACPLSEANSAGAGRACATNSDCGTQAPYCTADIPGVASASYCTKNCTSADACGDGAHCMPDPRNGKLFLCMPDGCIPDGTNTDIIPTPLADCLPSGANGVGKACTSAFECIGIGVGYFCTGTSAPVSFCTKFCENNNSCGTGNSCETDPSSGKMACVPNSCLP